MTAPAPVQVALTYQVVPQGPVSIVELEASLAAIPLANLSGPQAWSDLVSLGLTFASDTTSIVFVPGIGNVAQRQIVFSTLPPFVPVTLDPSVPATAQGSIVSSSPADTEGGAGCQRIKILYTGQDGIPAYAYVRPKGTTFKNLEQTDQILFVTEVLPDLGSPVGLFYLYSGPNGTGQLLAEGTGPILTPTLQNFQGSILSSSPADNATQTTIAAASDGELLPRHIVNVASTAGFPSSGTFLVTTDFGVQTVAYKGVTATQFTGCTGGQGSLGTGAPVLAGVGAYTVQITYLDATGGGPHVENVTLDGTKPVNLVNLNHATITNMMVTGVGAFGSSCGIISLMTGLNGTGGLAGHIGPSFFQFFPQQTVVSAAIVPSSAFKRTGIRRQNDGSYINQPLGAGGTPGNLAPGSPPNANPVTATRTTIAPLSNGVSLPQPVINVASTAGFAPGGGVILVTTSTGVQTVTYTGATAIAFTGCTGGTGVMSQGGPPGVGLVQATNIIAADTGSPFRGKYTQAIGAALKSNVIELAAAFS